MCVCIGSPERNSDECGRAWWMLDQVAQGMIELLLRLMVRSSSDMLFLALSARTVFPVVVEMCHCRETLMCAFLPLIVLQCQQTGVLAL